MARAMGMAAAAAILDTQANSLREKFDAKFRCEDLSTCALALDGNKRPCRVRSSNAGHALFAGLAPPDKAARVTRALLAYLRGRADIAVAVTPSRIDSVPGAVGDMLRNTFDPARTGDILLVQAASVFFGTRAEAAGHGSPYAYDRHVPMAFLLPGRPGRMVWREIPQRAMAPTLAMMLHVPPPSNAFVPALREVLE